MSYDNIISRGNAGPLMKQDVKKPAPDKGLAGPSKTKGKPPAHPPTKHPTY